MYSTVVIGLPKEDLEANLRALKKSLDVKDDTQVTADGWRQLVGEYKSYFKQKTGKDFPEDPDEQLWGAIGAVFESWMARKGGHLPPRREESPACSARPSTSCRWSSAIRGENSGTGVCFTRDPSTGEKIFFGDFLINAQGEDVVAGIRTPHAPERTGQAACRRSTSSSRSVRADTREALSRHAGHGVHRRRAASSTCCRRAPASASPAATFRMAVDMANEGLIKREEAIERIKSEDIERLFYPVLDPKVPTVELASAQTRERHQRRSRRGGRQGRLHRRRSRRMGRARRKGDSRAPRNQPRGRRRHVRGAGNSHRDGRQDQPRRRRRARLGQVLHRRRREARYRCRRQEDERRTAA